jgi:hypothetical protein
MKSLKSGPKVSINGRLSLFCLQLKSSCAPSFAFDQLGLPSLSVLAVESWKLFAYLNEHAGRICAHEELLQAPSSKDNPATGAALDITVSRLRQKLEDEPNNPCLIVTIRGRGYLLDEQGLVHRNNER